MCTGYIFIEGVASSFKAKDGSTVDGYNIFLLERKAEGERILWNLVRKWSRSLPDGAKFGAVCKCAFDSNGKLIELEVL